MRNATLLLCLMLLAAACGQGEETPAVKTPNEPFVPPDYVSVDHILIGVKGPRMLDGLSVEEARRLAYDLVKQVEDGADWTTLKRKHSKDPGPDGKGGGPYAMANHGKAPRSPDEAPRGGMVPAFGNVGFTLRVGEIKVADYHATDSPYGFHIIKRVK